jgi:hypothetical protein
MQGVNLAYYEKKDWKQFIAMIDDKESMHERWEDWYKDFQKTRDNLTALGFLVREVRINIGELRAYCLERGVKIDGKARSQFVSQKR